jgi:hypothetical protein
MLLAEMMTSEQKEYSRLPASSMHGEGADHRNEGCSVEREEDGGSTRAHTEPHEFVVSRSPVS